jgi:hypothetical protein
VNVLVALRPAVVVLAALLLAVLVQWGLLAAGVRDYLVPPPEMEVEQFLRALEAHHYGAAHDRLSEALGERVSEDDLRSLVDGMEAVHGGIAQVAGLEATETGDVATASVHVRFADDTESTLEFPLIWEQGRWHLEKIETLPRPSRR